jgi:hypothetical protein
MTGQSTAAAERSAGKAEASSRRFICRRHFVCSFAARVLPPLVQVCSEACAADEGFAAR